ncbi:MAG TPA: pyrrolo-quinoline quinone, partial [Clostridiales bacterium]|nr:pyrrolo-quinoline quinone [Clostridiales bacterium]
MSRYRNNQHLGFLCGILAAALLLAACAASPATAAPTPIPTATPTATATVAPTMTPTPTPSPTPSPSPTPTPPITDPAQLALDLDALPGYTAGSLQSDGSSLKTLADGSKIRWWVFNQENALLKDYQPRETVAFGDPETFTQVEGVLTFRGNHYRTAPAWGTADISENKLEIVWTKDIGAISGTGSWWPGAGWTGQPLL